MLYSVIHDFIATVHNAIRRRAPATLHRDRTRLLGIVVDLPLEPRHCSLRLSLVQMSVEDWHDLIVQDMQQVLRAIQKITILRGGLHHTGDKKDSKIDPGAVLPIMAYEVVKSGGCRCTGGESQDEGAERFEIRRKCDAIEDEVGDDFGGISQSQQHFAGQGHTGTCMARAPMAKMVVVWA